MAKQKKKVMDPKQYTGWTYETDGHHLFAKKYNGKETSVKIPKFYDIEQNAFLGHEITELTLLCADKLHHLWDGPMPGCEKVQILTLHYSGEGAAFLHLRGWAERLPNLSRIEICCSVQHQLIIWEGVPELSHDIVVNDPKCKKLNVYGHTISSVTLPTEHFFLSIPLKPVSVPDPAMRAALLLTALRKPEILSEEQKAEYRNSLKRNGIRWLPVFMDNGVSDGVVLEMFKEIQPIKPAQYELLLEEAQKHNNTVLAAAVLEERVKYVDIEKEEKKREKRNQYDFNHPFSARNMHKEWRWENLDDKTIILTKCLITDEETIYIPPEIAGKPVTALGDCLFVDNQAKEIILHDGITRIGASCFCDSGISTVALPDNLKQLGSGAFMSCRNLKEMTIPAGIGTVPQYTFAYSSVETVHISAGISGLSEHVFFDCKQLTDVTLPEGMEFIGRRCFAKCRLEKIQLPSSLNKIGEEAFERSFIQECELPPAVLKIPVHCFSQSHIGRIQLPAGLEEIQYEAFSDCKQLSKVVFRESLDGDEKAGLPDSVSGIGKNVFSGCSQLEELRLSARMGAIPTGMFMNSGLRHITISRNVRQMAKYAFAWCKKLETVTFEPDSELATISSECFTGSGIREMVLPGKLRQICTQAFYGCRQMRRLEFPKGAVLSPKALLLTCLVEIPQPDDSEIRVFEALERRGKMKDEQRNRKAPQETGKQETGKQETGNRKTRNRKAFSLCRLISQEDEE